MFAELVVIPKIQTALKPACYQQQNNNIIASASYTDLHFTPHRERRVFPWEIPQLIKRRKIVFYLGIIRCT